MSTIKDVAVRVFYATGLAALSLKEAGRGKALILAYHHVIPRKVIRESSLMTGMYLSSQSFEDHLDWLSRHFRVVPLETIVEMIRTGLPWKETLCALTFDDGWKDVYDHARPLLRRYDMPATVFSVGSMVGSQGPQGLDGVFEAIQMTDRPDDLRTGVAEIDALIRSDAIPDRVEKARMVINQIRELPYEQCREICATINRYLHDTFDLDPVRWKYETMSWDDMREAQGDAVDFGYHSKTHPILTKVPRSLLDAEVVPPFEEYKKEGVLLKPIFCYPDGKFTDEAISVLEEEGYEGAVTLQKGYNDSGTDPFLLKRVNIHEGNGGNRSRFVLSIGMRNR